MRRIQSSGASYVYGTTGPTGNLTQDASGFGLLLTDRILLTCRYGTGDRVEAAGYVVS